MEQRHTELLEQAKAHYTADMLLKGTYGEDYGGEFRGCSVGCHLFHIKPDMSPEEISDLDNKHEIVADYYGYPEWLALLQDTLFEGLPDGENAKWHVQLAEAIASRDGAIDWRETLHRVHIGILRISYQTAGTAQEAVQGVIDLHEASIRGEPGGDAAWSAAESAARSAAWSAAWSAARSAARSAAWSAAESAAWSAAESAAYQEIREAVLKAIAAHESLGASNG
jgi:hypothetical protein